MVDKGGRAVLLIPGQGNPGLKAVQVLPVLALSIWSALRMNNASPRRHPVDGSGLDHQIGSE